jgi:SAM-dependent methyltransferase
MNKQFSTACERNREPILQTLSEVFSDRKHVLEIGSGTGQHAVFFGAALPQLIWQTGDLPQSHPSILAWLQEAELTNVLPPIVLDMSKAAWETEVLDTGIDAVFTANTCHIMAWSEVERMFAGLARVLHSGGKLCVYGPFNYDGQFTSAGNAQFDASLRAQAAHMGIRDIEAMQKLAAQHGFVMLADHALPANNRLLVWQRS